MGVDQPGGLLDLRVGRTEAAVADVLANGALEEVGRLQDDAQLGLEPAERAIAVVDAIEEDPPPVGS